MSDCKFVHLRVHSDYSMLDGLNKVKPLISQVKSLNMPAVALTDQMNMCGLVKFYEQAHANGIKPIIGTDFWVQSSALEDHVFRLTLLAANNKGYKYHLAHFQSLFTRKSARQGGDRPRMVSRTQ